MKITKDNWNEIIGDNIISFNVFVAGSYCTTKLYKPENSFNQIRYLEPDDIILIVKKRLKSNMQRDNSQTRKRKEKLLKILNIIEKKV